MRSGGTNLRDVSKGITRRGVVAVDLRSAYSFDLHNFAYALLSISASMFSPQLC